MKYLVEVREVWVQGYEIEAKSAQEAMQQLKLPIEERYLHTEPIDSLFEFSHELDPSTWTARPAD